MNDMSQVIIPKSDQLNADSFLAGPQTVTNRAVQIRGGQEQPVNILLEETDLAFRPCKSMSRVLVNCWGPDAKVYVGRSLTLYRDPSVKWGGLEVGGIRISHMSHIDGKMQLQLTATKGQRKPHIVIPLVTEQRHATEDPAAKWSTAFLAKVRACNDLDALSALEIAQAKRLAELREKRPELSAQCEDMIAEQRTFLTPEGRADDDMGDGSADEFEAGED